MEIFGYPIYYFIAIAALIFYGFRFLVRAKKTVSKGVDFAKNVNNMRKTFVINEQSGLNTEQYKKLLHGASIFAFDSDYLNDLKSTRSNSTMKDILDEWWDINDKESFFDSVDYLFENGDRGAYAEALRITIEFPEKQWQSEINKLADAYETDYNEYCENIKESMNMIQEKNLLKAGEEKIDILAWDMGRVIYLARHAKNLNYISEEEAWNVIDKAVSKMQKVYNSWEETARGFMLGRNMWNGDYGQLIVTTNTYRDLINDPESPFKEISYN